MIVYFLLHLDTHYSIPPTHFSHRSNTVPVNLHFSFIQARLLPHHSLPLVVSLLTLSLLCSAVISRLHHLSQAHCQSLSR
ncbi:hypothetical protein Scep_006989 [Stephania cephalantha]|uniref:Uncharacterized protein n=1 Tax=Stephania cephalantha TaxID=152367 RepID=A0AAP0KBK2_9MAGN